MPARSCPVPPARAARGPLLTALAAASLLALLALPAQAQRRSEEVRGADRWNGRLPRGGDVRIQSMKGDVRVEPGSGGEVEVIARRADSRRNREPLELDVVEHDGGVTICVLTEDRRCSADGLDAERRGWSSRDSDYDGLDLTVRVPNGANLIVATGNGGVQVEGTDGDVRASSGNGAVTLREVRGAVRASTGNGAVLVDRVDGEVQASSGNGRVSVVTAGGPVRASTGNGAIDVRMGSLRDAGDLQFSTGNGRVVVTLPDEFEGELDMQTGRGDAVTDFPVRVSGRMRPNRIQGTVGDGRGPRVRVSSGNGDVEVRRGGGGER